MFFKKKENFHQRLSESELERLYEIRDKLPVQSEDYEQLTKVIVKETEALKNLTANKPPKNSINWIPLAQTGLAAAMNLAMLYLAMDQNERGHLIDLKTLGFFKNR